MTPGRLKIWNELAGEWEYPPGGEAEGGSQPLPAPIVVTPADVPNDGDTVELITPNDGDMVQDVLFSLNPAWDKTTNATLYDGDPDTGMTVGADGQFAEFHNDSESTIDDFGARGFVSLAALTGGSAGDNFPYRSTGEPLTLKINYGQNEFPVFAVNQGTKTFSLTTESAFNVADYIAPGGTFQIVGSTGNDGTYTVVSIGGFADPQDVVVVEAIPNAIADGSTTLVAAATTGEVQFILDVKPVAS